MNIQELKQYIELRSKAPARHQMTNDDFEKFRKMTNYLLDSVPWLIGKIEAYELVFEKTSLSIKHEEESE